MRTSAGPRTQIRVVLDADSFPASRNTAATYLLAVSLRAQQLGQVDAEEGDVPLGYQVPTLVDPRTAPMPEFAFGGNVLGTVAWCTNPTPVC